MIVTVGAGASEEQQKMGALQQVFAIQKEMNATDPMQAMVSPKQMYSALSDFVELNGLGDPDQFFLDPESPEGQQMAQMKQQQAQQQQQQAMQEQQTQLADATDGAGRTAEGGAGRAGQGSGDDAERSVEGPDRRHEEPSIQQEIEHDEEPDCRREGGW